MKRRLLIADSFRVALEREQSILNRTSFEVFTTLSGSEALALHKEHAMDLIITALELNDISGDDLCSIIRQDNTLKNVSVIIICDNNPACVERATHCGANTYLSKPFHSDQLTEKVTALLSIPQRQSYRVLLKASVRGTQDRDPFFCSSRDISSGGIMIETERTMKRGDIITLSFVLPGHGQISADGEIMRIDTRGVVPGYGVRFLYLSHRDREAIKVLIAGRSRQKSGNGG
jgi:DNA-binding response OmpR family regulator